jgi:hypothetical protein
MPKKRLPAAPTTTTISTEPLALSPTAQALVARVSADWTLTPPAAALLRLVAEHLTRAEHCDEILAREGLVVPDLKGASRAHPLALLSRDHKNAASNGLQRLMSNLE